MRKYLKLILLISLMATVLLFAVSCGNKKTEAISVSEQPQLVYVRGQELNLSGGTLKVDSGKKSTTVPLTSSDVKVSGYNKDTVGEQKLIIEYDGVKTEITVKVIERMVISNTVSDYLVGDSIDTSKGKVVVTDNSGNTKVVSLSSNQITLSGFDSSAAKSGLEIKVKYNAGSEEYEGSYKVNVHAVDSVTLYPPSIISYGSHYSGKLDITGAYFLLKGNGGAITRTVDVTENMVSGFDLSAVSSENPSVDQRITVKYNNKSYYFDIRLTYTDISKFNDNANLFNSMDWNGDTLPTIENEAGELAISLMKTYFEMLNSDKALVSSDTVFNVARTAMVYGFGVWAKDIRRLDGAFEIVEGTIQLRGESYAKVEDAVKILENKNSDMYKLSPILANIIRKYGDALIYKNESTRTYIYFNSYPVMDEFDLVDIRGMLQDMLSIYDLISVVPEGWQESGDLSEYASDIELSCLRMVEENYADKYPGIYSIISSWRAEDDLFDILYSYFFSTDNTYALKDLYSLGMPKKLETLYTYVFNALVQINNIKYLETTDASTFLYYYYRSNAVANEIKAMKGSVEEFVYQNMPVNHWFGISSQQAIDFEDILDSIRTEACGYYDLSASLVGNSEYESLVSEYVIILKNLSETDGYEATADYAARVKSVFDKFIALSPSEQYSLLATFNVLYTVGSPELTFDDSEENLKTGSLSQFNIIINSFMRSKLSAENTAIYNNLILAIEIYANRSGYDGWKKDFTDRMNAVKTALDSMTNEDDKNNFNTYLGAAYKKYSDIKANLDTDIELGEWQDEFDMLRDALINVQTGYSIMSRNGTYFLASFERASAIAEKILSGASDKIKEAYYHRALFEAYPADAEKGTEAIFWTYDYAITLYRNVYVDFLLFYSESRINIYDTYVNTNVGKFLDTYYDMIVAFLGGNDGSAPMFNRENTLNVLNEFRLLNSATKSLFGILDNLAIEDGEPVSLYYSALSMFIKEAFTEKAAAVATKLYLLEQYYYSYETSPNSVTLKALVATLDQLKELYKDLSGVDSDSFAPLVESYDYYVEKCEELTK